MEPTRYELSDIDSVVPPSMVKAFLLYELPQVVDVNKVIVSLQEGLKNAILHMPLMQGHVMTGDSRKPYIQTTPDQPLELHIRHLSQTEHKPYSELAQSFFAAEDLHLHMLLPEHSFGRVCALQLSVIQGGLILGFAMHHAAGDWTSMNAFLALLCRGAKADYHGLSMPVYTPDLNRAPFNAQENVGSIDQKELLARCPEFSVEDITVPTTTTQSPPPPIQTRIYRTTEASIQNLKQQCSPVGVAYLTSYDCISALLWTSITRARLLHHPEKHSSHSILANPINSRLRDPEHATSQDYFGNAVLLSWNGPVDVQSLLADNGLSAAASLIRKSINESSLESMKDLANLVRSFSPSQRLGVPMDFHNMDVLMNSWYSGKAENYDIGIGSPFALRTHRPNTGACCLILPNFSRSSSRVYEVFVQLPAEEHRSLCEDLQFSSCFEPLN